MIFQIEKLSNFVISIGYKNCPNRFFNCLFETLWLFYDYRILVRR
ncbi:Uncharacterized protein dnm_077570 [Desulfonema magnum]|uniref:Uncharacterized protein n=1 Tax=Desulfonema magnum TaxID=45655 RepID=A0A975BTY9_9BACT|nr:Uncharacterized protein dnm_077570 [Desulfonema magnum]